MYVNKLAQCIYYICFGLAWPHAINNLKTEVLVNEEEESNSHLLFLHSTFTRACWHGSTLAIHTSDFDNISVQASLNNNILRFRQLDQERMEHLCSIFTLDNLES